MVKLKKCPFCGGDAHFLFSGRKYEDAWKGYIVVRCQYCRGQMTGAYYKGTPITAPIEDTEEAIRVAILWNRRDGEWDDGKGNGD